MKKSCNINLYFLGLLLAIILSSCAERNYNFSLKNTLAIFLLHNEKGSHFCIPVQYMGDYHIGNFAFNSGKITVGGFDIFLERDNVNISVYLNEKADEYGSITDGFNLIYQEEKSKILLSGMNKPFSVTASDIFVHYYIFIERYLNDAEVERITYEYENGNIRSTMRIEYDLAINNETQNGNSILDEFEISAEPAIDSAWFPANLNFFKIKYLL